VYAFFFFFIQSIYVILHFDRMGGRRFLQLLLYLTILVRRIQMHHLGRNETRVRRNKCTISHMHSWLANV
jgi:hypothetical protein